MRLHIIFAIINSARISCLFAELPKLPKCLPFNQKLVNNVNNAKNGSKIEPFAHTINFLLLPAMPDISPKQQKKTVKRKNP